MTTTEWIDTALVDGNHVVMTGPEWDEVRRLCIAAAECEQQARELRDQAFEIMSRQIEADIAEPFA